MKTLCSLITLSAIVFLLRASPAIAQKQPVKMTVSYSAAGGQYINLFVAKEFGVFEKHGLEVTLNQINSSSQAVAALRSKSVDVATGPAGVIFDAIAKGVTDFMMFGECMPATVLEVWVQPNIKSVKDLVGKTISSTNPNSLGDLMIGVWLARNGIKKSDVNVVYLGGLGNLISAMKANKTDATLILPPLGEQLLPSGQKRFGDLRDIIYSNQAWTTTKSYAAKNSDALQRFAAAITEGIAFVKREKQKSLSVLPKYAGVTNEEWNAYAYDFFMPLLTITPRVTPEVVKATQELSTVAETRKLNLKPYINNAFVDKLVAQGFIDRLYK
ncbi:MAG TPA: ABC transporter substrate-binding protein [Terriglobales bacterium]|jgi:NitT/TauT family transport system substrate-binding protein|nr:ABC transporter substrate-binding protein [Terriglobales bacterium]